MVFRLGFRLRLWLGFGFGLRLWLRFGLGLGFYFGLRLRLNGFLLRLDNGRGFNGRFRFHDRRRLDCGLWFWRRGFRNRLRFRLGRRRLLFPFRLGFRLRFGFGLGLGLRLCLSLHAGDFGGGALRAFGWSVSNLHEANFNRFGLQRFRTRGWAGHDHTKYCQVQSRGNAYPSNSDE
jgi:hypothetical protein